MHLNTTILRKIRDKIISVLKAADVDLQKHYQLSAINEVSTTFTLTVLMKSPTPRAINGRLGTLKEILSKEFQGITFTNMAELKVRLDLMDEYRRLKGPDGEEAETAAATASEKRKVGRPKENLSELQDEVIATLKSHTRLKMGETGMGFVVLPRVAGKWEVVLRFKNEVAFFQGLRCLEAGYAKQIKIVDAEKKWIFSISTSEIIFTAEQNKKNDEALRFFILMKQTVRELDERAVLLSSYLYFAQDPSKNLVIQCSEPATAVGAKTFFPQNFKFKKDGTLVTLSVPPDSIASCLQSGSIKTSRPKAVKGLLTSKNGSNHVYVHSSMNYDDFYFLPFNRKTTNKHVVDIVESVKMFGVLTFVVVVETDVVNGVMRKWIVDGQHRFKAYKYEGLPILYTKAHASTKHELVRLIAKLNHTSKNWSLINYLDAWTSLHIEEYLILKEAYERTSLPLTMLLQIYENKTNRKNAQLAFCDGRFKVVNLPKAEQQINYLVTAQTILPTSRDLCAGLLHIIRKYDEHYDHQRMMANLQKVKKQLPFAEGDEFGIITQKFERIYNAAA